MSLRAKIVLGLLTVALLYAGMDHGVHRTLAGRVFGNWEEHEAQESLERALAAVDVEGETLRRLARTWAAREETLRVLDGEESALEPDVLEQSGVDLFYICDARGEEFGRVRWHRALDPETGEPAAISRDLPTGSLSAGHPLLNIEREDSDRLGLMMTDGLPLLVVSSPVPVPASGSTSAEAPGELFLDADPERRDKYKQAAHGYVILGRFVGGELSERVRAMAGADLSVHELDDGDMEGVYRDLLAGLTSGESRAVSRVGEDGRLHVYATLTDMRSLRPLVFEARMERRISGYGERVVNYAMLSSVVSVLLFVFVLLLLLQVLVLRPLSTLKDKAVVIGKTDDTTIRVGIERSDEIGTLATEFDSMLEKLAVSRRQLVETARSAGMSEIATGVLHNVGNVLNSVNVSASMVRRGMDRLGTADLERFLGVLEAQGDDLPRFLTEDPRGKHALPFLRELVSSLQKDHAKTVAEVREIIEGIDHVSDLVRSQQSYAGAKGVFELSSLETEVEAALKICRQAKGPVAEFEVAREFEPVPSVPVDKHKLMEILVNLIQNATQAMSESPQRRLTLRILELDPETVRIEVEDSGCGIAEESLEKVFHHGFTTKSDGHGFGLHTAANAATEMDGKLRVRSDGPGKGAAFSLDLPMSRDGLRAAA